ncbi:bifunctional helix-turn-helix transcriptional regulator/GNAT family N-acetyltransferase [Fulvivirga lutea]|uniref:Bifunctional helix-turn-helix transcriptional regulator/GNAT family N-acetyltransferase n=1 Tax=Fulvivirga lutea TaxID=2810512 RepID=A0A974WDH6_9BACT|nr:bifunctional helix-turn-helix transcriptional regulator/GNAT family N-acetyltransferase [Fulvivirga lutea]QSE96059.1 bifunctional helix-turn-helix transcriptional regulator/GNAT family N-acetyltransferase [Fulvivirga lutea]
MNILNDIGYLSIGSRLRRIYEKLQIDGDKIYSELGLNFKSSWFAVFYALSKQDNQSITQLANQIAFTHITVKNIVRELEASKLVKITANKTDKRSKVVSLTPKGEQLKIKLLPVWESFGRTLKDLFQVDNTFINALTEIDQLLEAKPLASRFKESHNKASIINAHPKDYKAIGQLMVEVYSQLDGFPKPDEMPRYYEFLQNVGELTQKPQTELFATYSRDNKVLGAVVFFGDMQYYSSGGRAMKEKNSAGFRLLAVSPEARGLGLGRELTQKCIDRAKELGVKQVVIHTTKAMETAWSMYEKIGFIRARELDFNQGDLEVFGFRLSL